MNNKQERINDILKTWEKKCYLPISSFQPDPPFFSPEEFKNDISYLKNCFNPAILELLELDAIEYLEIKLSEFHKYIRDNADRILKNISGVCRCEFAPESKEEYQQKLNELKSVFQQIEHINIYIDLYSRGDRVIKETKERYDKKIAELLGEANEVYLYSEYKKQVDEVSKRIKRNIWILIFLFVLIPTTHIIISAILMPKLGMDNESISAYLVKLLFTIPLVWVILFTIRYIKEDRKIEQTYKHKEVVTRTYLNFLEMLNKEPYLDDDGKIRKILSRIAVESMGLNPALLLDKSTAEKIPMEELLTRIMDRASGNSDGASQQK